MEKSRFSMLILEPGEIYFEDFSCVMDNAEILSPHAKQGRLKLCSKSLVFEPREWAYPIVKLHYKDALEIATHSPISTEGSQNIIKVKVRQYSEMLQENILTPYIFSYEQCDFFFYLDFALASECLCPMLQLQRASTLHAPEHNSMVATILHSRYMRMVFDQVMMDDFTERIICEMQAEKISPLVRNQGKLALTPTTLYFQPFNNIESCPILKIKLKNIKRMYKRRFLLRHVGMEIYCEENSQIPHIYLSFHNENERNKLYSLLEKSPGLNLERVHIEEMTLQWQNGVVSNYDYLMYLNCLADRSKNDLTQYPVFPWVIADYKSDHLDLGNANSFRDLSKPMGALNPDRLEKLLERYEEMSDPKFLYGSHYSAPGLVLFYLVRKYPQYMLCLQNGRFDHPDRMFNSLSDVYNNCLKNMSDFKELIPEFYDTEANGDFLVNKYNIEFGERHNGDKVDNVNLPPWCESAEDFVIKLRQALESDYVSRYLHLWIDLIFGYKQRGEEAVKANNVFYHLCYEGSVDLESVADMNDRHALEVQIMEFGQVPKQLFTTPHCRKLTHRIQKPLENNEQIQSYNIECIDTIRLHREEVTSALVYGNRVVSVGKDGTLKVYDKDLKKQIRSVILCPTTLSSCVMIDEHMVAVGSWCNDIYLYDVEYGRVVENFRAHDDSVTCLLWSQKDRYLISGGWDCVVRVWGNVGKSGQALRGLKAELDHDGKVTAVTCRRTNSGRHTEQLDLISSTSDGEVYIWRVSTQELLNKISVSDSPIHGLCLLLPGDRVVTVSENGDMIVTDLSVSHSVYQKQLPEPVTSLCWNGSNVLWLGGVNGQLLQWNMITVTPVNHLLIHDDSITSISMDASSETFVTASKDRSVKLWKLTSNS